MSPFKKIGADRLAYEVAMMIIRNEIDSRSSVADALLDYMEIGTSGKPQSVHEWIEKYENNLKLKEGCQSGLLG